jgi:MYXO-CTERM domain-containing protein
LLRVLARILRKRTTRNIGERGHAFAWTADAGFTILGEGVAFDVNDAGQIAGRLLLSPVGDGSDACKAVVWEPVSEPPSFLALVGGLGYLTLLRRRRPVSEH